MKILSLSYLNIWPHGEGKGIPSIFLAQKGLVDRGHEVHFVSPAWRSAAGTTLYHGIHIHRFRLPYNIAVLLGSGPLRVDGFWKRLRASFLYNLAWFVFQVDGFFVMAKIASQVRPRVIYAHDLTPAFPAWLVSRMSKARFILRIYGTRGLYWSYKNWFSRLREFRDYEALKLPADYLIITKDGTNADRLASELGVNKGKVRSWRNGVDFSIYDPDPDIKKRVCQKLGIAENKKIIISSSRLIPFYQVDRLVYRLPEVFEACPDVVCIIASDGAKKQEFQEWVASRNIQDKVIFTGMVDKASLKDLLNASDLYVNLTSYSNCNNALLEAMVAGKAIVSLDNVHIRELVDSGENGYLIRECELDCLPAVLCRILNDVEMMNKFKANIRKAASEKLWTWEKRIDEEAKLLETLI